MMQYFSTEYRDKLVNEHKLVSATIARLSEGFARLYINRHGTQALDLAVSNMKARKVELEASIDVLNEFLNG